MGKLKLTSLNSLVNCGSSKELQKEELKWEATMVLHLSSNSGKVGREGNMPEGNRRTMSSWGRLGQVNTATQAVSLSPPESFILILRSSGQMGVCVCVMAHIGLFSPQLCEFWLCIPRKFVLVSVPDESCSIHGNSRRLKS